MHEGSSVIREGALLSPSTRAASYPAAPLLLILVLWAAGLAAAAQFAKVAVILPDLAVPYPGRGARLGFLVSLISVLGIALGLVAGLVAARFGPRRLLLGALALGAALSLVQAALPPFSVMLATRVAEGLSHLGIVVAAPTLIGTLSPPARRGAAMTLWGTFFGVAFAVTALAGVPLARAHGPGALFLAHGAFAALVGAALWVLLPRDDPGGGRAPAASAEGLPLDRRALARRHAAAYGSARVAAPAAGWLFYTLTFVALLTVLPTLVPPEERAFVAAAMPLASIAVSMTLGVALLRRMEAVSVIVWGFALSIGIALAFAAAPGGPWLPIALLGALGLVQGASFAAVPELNAEPEAQALAHGAVAQMGNLGNVAGTPLLLAVLAEAGFRTMIALVIGCWLAGLAAHLLLRRRRHAASA